MFSFDRVHYARWLPIFIRNLEYLEGNAPSVYQEFLEGHFSNHFSDIAIDQAYEQNDHKCW